MLSLLDLYYDFLKAKGMTEPRSGIIKTLEHIENGHDVILKAPTGYGKTTLTEILAMAVTQDKNDIASRVIHILPLRAIVQDLYKKIAEDDAKVLKITRGQVGAQDMDYHDSPIFMKKVNITTLDTFTLNLFKLPIAEFDKIFKNYGSHYEFPRAMIYSSIVLFDEFHLLGEEGKSLTAGLATIEALKEANIPMVVMSATIDDGLIKFLKDILNDVSIVEVTDYNINRKVNVNFIDNEDEIFGVVEKKIKEGKRVLITYNTRTKAIEAYYRLKEMGFSALLIHSKFNKNDRKEKIEKIRTGEARLVISTQVIEAGIDTSFDVLITEEAPSHNLIQRSGRVARYGGEGDIYIFPLTEKSKTIYDWEEVEMTTKLIEKERRIDEKVLLSRNYQIDKKLFSNLKLIEGSIFANSKKAKKLYESICTLTRETGIVLGFPPRKVDVQYAVPLTNDEALQVLKKNNNAFVGNSDHINIRLSNHCLQLEFLRHNIQGVMISGYDSEVGAIL